MEDHEFRDLVDRIKERVDIVQVIGQRISLNRNLKARCPFHDDTNPSLSVKPEWSYFRCFGCGTSGDVITFLMLYEKKTFWDVVSGLAREAGIPLPGFSREDKRRMEESRTIEDILSETAKFYHGALTSEVRKYLTGERGLSEETIAPFQIGYASGGLRKHLTEKCTFPLELCLKAGVLKKDQGGQVWDFFYKRIIFPNVRRGRVAHLSGRNLDGSEPKYLHLPGEIRYLYNEDALSGKNVFVVEGITDCLSAVQEGFPAVAILGSHSFKPEYRAKFSRCETVYICLDSDKAGQEGALRTAEHLADKARIIRLPEGLDLNDYLKNNSKEDFEALVASAQDIIQHELDLIPPDTKKTELPRKLDPILKKLARMEEVKVEAYLGEEFKRRFRLNSRELDAYRKLIKKYRSDVSDVSEVSEVLRKGREAVFTASFPELVDLVEHDGNPAFLIKEEDGKLSIQAEYEREGKILVPPPRDQIRWLLPRGDRVLQQYTRYEIEPTEGIDGALYDDLLAYHKDTSELPADEHYDLIVAWGFHTHLSESFQYSPIVCLFAVPERGKTRTGKGMIYVARRGIHVESLREAYILRVASDLGATIFFDVKDIWRKAERNQSEDILLQRFERGLDVARVLYPDKGAYRDMVYYKVFGPTVISTNEGVHKILGTRAITINMPETSRRFENDVTPEVALHLKERLVAFRARHLGETLPDILKPAPGRLGDILKPIHQIILLVRPQRETHFLKLVRRVESERLTEKADSFEGQILKAIIDLEEKVEKGVLAVKDITEALNEGKPERFHITPQRIGRRLTAMGFTKGKTSDGASAIIWGDEKIERMKTTYGLKETSVTSETSETPVEEDDNTGVSKVADVPQLPF